MALGNVPIHGAAGEAHPAAMEPAARKRRIVVVDDSPVFLAAVDGFIRSLEGYELAGLATCGAEAIELVRATRPDVVLLDVAMPGMDGLEVARRLKAAPDAPVIVLVTLHPDEGTRSEAARAGVDAVLAKTDLVSGLAGVLEGTPGGS
jgi:CheY-like chemotaxis protein